MDISFLVLIVFVLRTPCQNEAMCLPRHGIPQVHLRTACVSRACMQMRLKESADGHPSRLILTLTYVSFSERVSTSRGTGNVSTNGRNSPPSSPRGTLTRRRKTTARAPRSSSPTSVPSSHTHQTPSTSEPARTSARDAGQSLAAFYIRTRSSCLFSQEHTQ